MTSSILPFSQTIEAHGLSLKRVPVQTLQMNTGLLCNQACRHCHLSAGPDRKQLMSRQTMDEIIAFQKKCRIGCVDITGGAPELNPHLKYLINNISAPSQTVMLRSNLSALYDSGDSEQLLDILKENKVVIVSSFPAVNASQTDSQRGKGTFEKSIQMLKRLNALGYGQPGSGLELNLVANPAGAFLPPSQEATEKRYRHVLKDKWDIVFNQAFSFANMPLGRFKQWLERSGNYDSYLASLVKNFNPCTIEGLMCRSLLSVSWDGYLFDCDFNLAAGIYKANQKMHISDLASCSLENDEIAMADHCYACTAGSGFT
jgi:radical SAM/Cys-rich protein